MIYFSEKESILYGCRMGRGIFDEGFNDWQEIPPSFNSQNLDFARVKIINPKADLFEQLENIGLSFFHLDIISQYRGKIVGSELLPLTLSNLSFEDVTPQNLDLFIEIVEQTYEIVPFGYYRHPYILQQFPIEIQKKAALDFFFSNYSGSSPNHLAQLVFVAGEPAGCVLVDWFSDYSHTPFIGVIKPFRQQGLLNDISVHVSHLTHQKGIEWAQGGARLHNFYTHYALEYCNLKCFSREWVFMLAKKSVEKSMAET